METMPKNSKNIYQNLIFIGLSNNKYRGISLMDNISGALFSSSKM
jgi:ribulose 1,5-bisphosphate synthetase/thiazole synthase